MPRLLWIEGIIPMTTAWVEIALWVFAITLIVSALGGHIYNHHRHHHL
jgi:hypothetical protein